ncbi:hypothetical protein HD554DRAFT_793702 [Boletus coccyginus]|nr:hypothetical protein HD554DRAFT_793702 [Boletus coccyginus]
MSLHSHKVLRRRSGYLPVSGSVVESNPTPTASLLAQNTQTVDGTPVGSPPPGIPLVPSAVSENTSTSATQSPTPIASTSSSTPSGNQISLGTVIGACVAALTALVLAVVLAFYCSRRHKRLAAYSKSRNIANNCSRRRSHLEPWKRMDDGGDRWEGQERPMKQAPSSASLGAMFQRSISNASGEKSLEGHNRESVGTMRHFVKYHPDLAAEMASQGTITGAGEKVAKPPPVLHLMGRGLDMAPPVSWDGETIGGESFTSRPSGLSNSTSTAMMATERSTPPATASFLHRWESAEVLHVSQVGSDPSEEGELPNPFADSASSVRSSTRGRNPFFSARDQPARRTLLPNTHKNPFVDENAPPDSDAAIQSLIAALQVPTGRGGDDRIVSIQSSLYSRMTGDDCDSAISVTAFPYPPTQINVR